MQTDGEKKSERRLKSAWQLRDANGRVAGAAPVLEMDGLMNLGLAVLGLLVAAPVFGADIPVVSNSEMSAIFKADQADRSTHPIDWGIVKPADAKRRERTEQLLDAGALRTGEDFYDAAFVFQHGETANDFLKAHLLAVVATAKGQPDAPWIAAATLDRYLQEIGRPQVLGTQFTRTDDGKFTQEPYDRTVASDAMRKAMQVPSLAEQEIERRGYEAQVLNSPAKSK
jgi:hypothetical protein